MIRLDELFSIYNCSEPLSGKKVEKYLTLEQIKDKERKEDKKLRMLRELWLSYTTEEVLKHEPERFGSCFREPDYSKCDHSIIQHCEKCG